MEEEKGRLLEIPELEEPVVPQVGNLPVVAGGSGVVVNAPPTPTPKKGGDATIVQVPVVVVRQRKAHKDVGELFDELILDLGGWGTYQQLIVFLVLLPSFFILAFMQCILIFVIVDPKEYWCSVPELVAGSSPINVTLSKNNLKSLMPWDPATGNYSQCRMYVTNYTQLLLDHPLDYASFLNGTGTSSRHNLTTSRCLYGWDYSTQQYDVSTNIEWNMICGSDSMTTLANVFIVIALILGTLTGGYVADRWGRKKPVFVFFGIFIVFGLSFAFAPTYAGFVVLAVLHTFGAAPIYYMLYATGVEMLTSKSRVPFIVWLSVFYAFGSMAFTLLAYFVRHWRPLTIYATAPFFLIFIYVFFLPESPRWLLVNERFEEVEMYMRKVARINGRSFDEPCQVKLKAIFLQCQREVNLQNSQLASSRKASWMRLFATPRMLRKTLLLTYLICNLQICYGGLRSFTPSFGGTDEYFGFFLGFLVEIPGYAITALVCDRFGRRLSVLLCFVAAFITCMATLAFPSDPEYYWGIIAVFLIAKIFIAAAYVVGELMLYETFPTVIRLQGVAFCEAVAFLVSHLGPEIVNLQFHSMVLPLVIFGCLALLAMLGVFLLPETSCTALPETVEEADMRGVVVFRQAVDLRVPRVKVKPVVSVTYRKKDVVVGYVPVPAGAGNGEATPGMTQEYVQGSDDHTGIPTIHKTPQMVTKPASEVAGFGTRLSSNSAPRHEVVWTKSGPPPIGPSEIQRVAASLKRVPRDDKSTVSMTPPPDVSPVPIRSADSVASPVIEGSEL